MMTAVAWVWFGVVILLVIPVGWGWLYLAVDILVAGKDPPAGEYRTLFVLTAILLIVGIGGAAVGLEPPID